MDRAARLKPYEVTRAYCPRCGNNRAAIFIRRDDDLVCLDGERDGRHSRRKAEDEPAIPTP